MANWDVVECVVTGEETANFGPRKESGTSYQCETVINVSPRNEVTSDPRLCAVGTEENLSLSIGNSLSIFDESGKNFLITLCLESEIDVLQWTTDSLFLVIGESNGSLHFVHKNSHEPVFSQALLADTDSRAFNDIVFTPADAKGYCTMMVLACNGNIFQCNKINFKKLNQAIDSKDLNTVNMLQSKISIVVLNTSVQHTLSTNCLASGYSTNTEFFVTGGSGDSILCIWTKDSANVPLRSAGSCLGHEEEIIKCEVICKGKFILTLDVSGTLVLWDTLSLTVLVYWPSIKLTKFSILETEGNASRLDQLKLIGLTPGVDEESTSLHIFNLPTLESIYTIQLSSTTVLACLPRTLDSIFILEGVYESSKFMTSVRLRSIVESQPETRFYQILHKNHFEEAEAHARLFNLDVELVYKVKASYILDKISPSNASALTEDELVDLQEQLKECFGKIKDDNHITECYVHAALPSLQATLHLLNYAKARVQKKEDDVTRTQMLMKILETLHRLCTFKVAFGPDQYSGKAWEHFMRTNLFYEVLKWLQRGHLSRAFSIWSRHSSEFKEAFTTEMLEELLSCIPDNCTSTEVRAWLCHDLIPFVMSVLPEQLYLVAQWLEQKARDMERHERDGWPANALRMSQLIQESCEVTEYTQNATPVELVNKVVCNNLVHCNEDTEGVATVAFTSLNTLTTQLHDVLCLHTKYNCRLSLSEYVKETTESLTFRMLDRVVAMETVHNTIDKVVRPYMREHQLHEDKLLFLYIEDLLERYGKVRSWLGEAPWEGKAIAVIGCIRDVEYKCQAVLKVMIQAHIPWSTSMEELVQDSLQWKSHWASDIQDQCDQMELMKRLLKYDLNYQHALTYSNDPMQLVKFILTQNLPSAVEDALQVAKTYNLNSLEIYLFRMRFLIGANEVYSGIEFMKTLPVDMTVTVAKNIVLDSRLVLNNKHYAKVAKKTWTNAGIKIIKLFLLPSLGELVAKEYKSLLNTLEQIHTLQVSYGEYLTIGQYESKKFRKTLLVEKVKQFFVDREKKDSKENIGNDNMDERKFCKVKRTSMSRLYRLSSALGFHREVLRGQLAIRAANMGEIKTALTMSEELYKHCPIEDTGEILYMVAHTICRHLATGDVTSCPPSAIVSMVNNANCICSSDLLMDCLELYKETSLAELVAQQCEVEYTHKSVKRHSNDLSNDDPYEKWTYNDFFNQEDGLVLDSTIVMPMTYNYTIACLPGSGTQKPYLRNSLAGMSLLGDEDETNSFRTLIEAALEIVTYLRENNQEQLALVFCNSSIDTAILHCTCQDLGFHISRKEREKDNLTKNNVMLKRMLGAALPTITTNTSSILVKIFNKRRVDKLLALGLMCTLPRQTAIQQLQDMVEAAGFNYKRILALAEVGIAFSVITKESKVKLNCEELLENASWGYRLRKLKILFKEAFMGQTHEKTNLIPVIVTQEGVDISLIKDYCKTFHLDANKALFTYIERLLQRPGGDDVTGGCTLTQDEKHARLIEAFQSISHKDELLSRLRKICIQIDPYEYEDLRFVLQQIVGIVSESTTLDKIKLLDYLTHYVRIEVPSLFEANYNRPEDDITDVRVLSSKSSKRLPFHILVSGKVADSWKVISPELNAETITRWIPIAKLLKFDMDSLYLNTIQNIVKKHIAKITPEGGNISWNTNDVDHKLFTDIKKLLLCVSQVKNAVMCANWIRKQLRMGAERVMALVETVALSERWLQSCTDKSEEQMEAKKSYEQCSELLRRLQTEQTLHLNNLGSDADIMKLVSSPAKLIMRLYEHGSILLRDQAGSPDINKIADEVAKINNYNASKLHLTLVEKWLPSVQQAKQEDADMTMTLNFTVNMNGVNQHKEDEDNLRRLIYTLRHSPIEKSAMFLLNFTFSESSPNIKNSSRVRALRCLFGLTSNKTLEKIAGKTIDILKAKMRTLLYLVQLDKLHIAQTVTSFDKISKEGLVRGIWRNHNNDHKAVHLMCDLCLDYNMYDVHLWNSMLQQLLVLGEQEYLRHVLSEMSEIPCLWQVDCLEKTWRDVLMSPLLSVVAPLSKGQRDTCLQSAILLHRSPLLLDADLVLFSEQFMKLELFACAMSCVVLVADGTAQDTLVQETCIDERYITILDELLEYADGNNPLPLAKQVEDFIYQCMESQKEYHILAKTKHFDRFVMYLVKHQKIDGLLIEAIRQSRLNEAVQVLKIHNSVHGADTDDTDSSDMEILKNYIKKNDLQESFRGLLGEN